MQLLVLVFLAITEFLNIWESNIDQTIEWIKSILDKEDELDWTIKLKEENIIIGTVGIKPSTSKQGYWEIGYNLHFDYWNNSYCT